VGGTITGLTAAGLVLTNGSDTVSPAANDTTFTFGTALANGAGYSVSVTTQPAGLDCTVTNGAGTIAGANVTNVAVACTPLVFALGGTVTGLVASGLVLEDLVTSEAVTVPNGATSFSFMSRSLGTSYNVIVSEQPAGLDCQILGGSGTILSDVTNLAVTCTVVAFTIGGTIAGLPGAALLSVTLAGGPTIIAPNGDFTFLGSRPTGFVYTVTVGTPPVGYGCTVANGTGTVGTANVTDVAITCAPLCGNGALDAGETCDEGDIIPGDGCSDTCQLETPAIGETEPNEDGSPSIGGDGVAGNDFARTNANPVLLGDLILARFGVPGDEDVFAFTNMGTQPRYVQVFTSGVVDTACAPNVDTGINVWDAAGTSPIATNDDIAFPDNPCSRVLVTVPPAATLYFHVTHYLDDSVGAYRLHVVDAGFCGDGTVNGPTGAELCEPAGTATCSATCQPVDPCGNGAIDSGEQCDDGVGQIPPANGDGCSSACQAEPGFIGEIEPNDDGTPQTAVNDFTVASAQVIALGPVPAQVVVLGQISPVGDEDGFAVSNPAGNPPLVVRVDTYRRDAGFGVGVPCGNNTANDHRIFIRNAAGVQVAVNADRNGSTDWCSGLEFIIPAGETWYIHMEEEGDNRAIGAPGYALRIQTRIAACGNGFVDVGEQCDDVAPAEDGDGCSATCTVEPGFVCNGAPSVCVPIPFVTIPLACVDMTGSTDLTPADPDEGVTTRAALPFTFPLYGTTMSHFSASTNGFVGVFPGDAGTIAPQFSNPATVPLAAAPNGYLAPFWEDLEVNTNGLRSQITGATPTRVFTLEWNASIFGVAGSNVVFQLQLREAGGIEYHYCSGAGDAARISGSSATVAAENATGTVGHAAGINTAGTVTPGTSALRWTIP